MTAFAPSLIWTCWTYETQGRYAEAELLFKRALATRKKALGPDHPDVVSSLGNLAALYAKQGRYLEGYALSVRAVDVLARRIALASAERSGSTGQQWQFRSLFLLHSCAGGLLTARTISPSRRCQRRAKSCRSASMRAPAQACRRSVSDISLIAHNGDGTIVDKNRTNAGADAGVGAGIGALVGGAGGLLAGLGMMAIPGVGPVVAAGWLVATAAGAVGGGAVGAVAGGIVGSMTDAGVDEREAQVYAEGVRRGGALVAVRADDEEEAMKARGILSRHQPVDPIAREAAYRRSGWRSFDETAPLYTAEEVQAERGRYR
jgi:hypothetical protein